MFQSLFCPYDIFLSAVSAAVGLFHCLQMWSLRKKQASSGDKRAVGRNKEQQEEVSKVPETPQERRTKKEVWEKELAEKEARLAQREELLQGGWQDLKQQQEELQLKEASFQLNLETFRKAQEQLEREKAEFQWDMERSAGSRQKPDPTQLAGAETSGTAQDEQDDLETRLCQAIVAADKESILQEAMMKQPAELRAFIARYSYDPFHGSNERPELELPLVAGQYTYVYGDVDEDGWYVGELSDGTRGFVPSNLVEEVSIDDFIGPVETIDWE